jgi:hypothetical protein
MFLEKKQLDNNDDNSHQEHKEGYSVDPMHVFHPLGMRRIGVPFPDIEILCKLSPDSHSTLIEPQI